MIYVSVVINTIGVQAGVGGGGGLVSANFVTTAIFSAKSLSHYGCSPGSVE